MTEAQKDLHAIVGSMENLFIEHGRTIHLDDPEMHALLVAANYLLTSAAIRSESKLEGAIHG
jgi:hypothetical protein